MTAPLLPVFTALRAAEAVLRNSVYRGAYELLFVPMDPATRRRAKTFLDVACDRAGEAAGSAIIQLLILLGVASISSSLLLIAILLSIAAAWIGRRFGSLYLDVVEKQLVRHRPAPAMNIVSEAGWTIVQLPSESPRRADAEPAKRRETKPAVRPDPQIDLVAELRAPELTRVTAALARRTAFEPLHVAQTVSLLARDDVLPAAREALEALAPSHLGMMIDALLDPATDFAIRRRLPRILGEVPSSRSVEGLISGLNDSRFEVRYHCSRAINRILTRNRELSVDRGRIIAVVERQLACRRNCGAVTGSSIAPTNPRRRRFRPRQHPVNSSTSFCCCPRLFRASRSMPQFTEFSRPTAACVDWRSSISTRCSRRPFSVGCAG